MQFWDKGPMLITGCTKVSPGCKNCWSERTHVMRMKNPAVSHIYNPDLITDGRFNGKVQFNLRLLKEAAGGKKPQVIAIWNDLYHEGVTDDEIFKAYGEILLNPQHKYLIITKRIERAVMFWDMVASETKGAFSLPRVFHHLGCVYDNEGDKKTADKFYKAANKYSGKYVLPLSDNIWHIVTCENQEQADKRIPHLLRIPGKRAIIIEPMLGHVDLTMALEEFQPLNPDMSRKPAPIHQVILGPENGPSKRPFDPAWAESVKAQCEATGVPYYRKDREEGTLAWRS